MFKPAWCIADIKFQKREARKLSTLITILKSMPATFSVLQDRVREGKKMSPSLLSKYLSQLIEYGIVKKNRNLYYFNSTGILGVPEWLAKERHNAILLALWFKLPVICVKKNKGEWQKNSCTYAQLMGWVENEAS